MKGKKLYRSRLHTLREQYRITTIFGRSTIDPLETRVLSGLVLKVPKLVKNRLIAKGRTPREAEFMIRNMARIIKNDEDRKGRIAKEISEIEGLLEEMF